MIVFRNSRADSQSVLHYTPKVSVAHGDPYRRKGSYRFYVPSHARSRLLIEKSKNLIDKSQKIVDDETAKLFEKASAQRKRNVRPPQA